MSLRASTTGGMRVLVVEAVLLLMMILAATYTVSVQSSGRGTHTQYIFPCIFYVQNLFLGVVNSLLLLLGIVVKSYHSSTTISNGIFEICLSFER